MNYPSLFLFCRRGICNFTMPINVDISKEDLLRMLWDGGLKPATLTSRKRFYDEVFYLLSVL